MRAIDTSTAVGLCAEIRDFAHFPPAGQLTDYLGLVAGERSSAESRRQAGRPAHVLAIFWAARRRRRRTWQHRDTERGKRRTIVATAHELAGFRWAIANAGGPPLHHVG